jgi:hypothetical protein
MAEPALRTAAVIALAAALGGCAEQQRPIREAPARQITPVPVCTEPIAPPARKESGKELIRDLDPEQWMAIMVPSYDEKGLDGTAVDCTGNYVFANETLRFGVPDRGYPVVVDPDDVDIRSGPKGLKAIRLRSLKFENGDVGGPIALARAVDDRAEIFGVGSYRGPADAELTPVRMGNETMLVAESRRCPDPNSCRKVADFYLARRGRLINAATVDLERTQRVPSVTEGGLYAEYKLTTDVTYTPQGVQLLEQVQVRIIPYEERRSSSLPTSRARARARARAR